MTGQPSRPWCCPEPRCWLLMNYNIAGTRPGESFICFGLMERPIEFSYDGTAHRNDLNHCDYTPLKGVIRWQENEEDWRAMRVLYGVALRKLRASRR